MSERAERRDDDLSALWRKLNGGLKEDLRRRCIVDTRYAVQKQVVHESLPGSARSPNAKPMEICGEGANVGLSSSSPSSFE